MRIDLYDAEAPKKPTNVTINSDLLAKAKECNINLSQTLESSLKELLRKKQIEKWQQQNKSAIESFNQHIEKNGVFSDGVRSF